MSAALVLLRFGYRGAQEVATFVHLKLRSAVDVCKWNYK